MIMGFGTPVWNDDISRIFFYFFEIFIFLAVIGLKGQKIAQNEKEQLHLSRAISQEQYRLWSWFSVHLCKMMISARVFFICLISLFFGLLGSTKKICLLQLISQEPYIIWLSFMVHLCKMMISLGVFFNFFKILILSHESLYDFYLWFLFMCKM